MATSALSFIACFADYIQSDAAPGNFGYRAAGADAAAQKQPKNVLGTERLRQLPPALMPASTTARRSAATSNPATIVMAGKRPRGFRSAAPAGRLCPLPACPR